MFDCFSKSVILITDFNEWICLVFVFPGATGVLLQVCGGRLVT